MSGVVRTSRPSDGVVALALEDREHSNLLTAPLVQGLAEGLERAVADPSTRAVVVHGYDSIFCTGGTRDELLGIFEGRVQFDDVPLYRLFLDCPLPVVAAMQGHALGGGLVIGLFADLVVLAEEALYAANFMKYGFTPGMGATAVLPHKFGRPLATEMLLTAAGYHGGELARRGVTLPVLPRKRVVDHALALAKDLASKPRTSLELLKEALTAELRQILPSAVEKELAMHRVTFAQPEVRRRIEELFGA